MPMRAVSGNPRCEYDLLHRTLTAFCQNHGLVFLRLDVDPLQDFRSTWKLNPRTTAKTLERLHSFFEYCLDSDWIEKNPAKSIKAAKVEDADVLPFRDEEVEKILVACDTFNGNGERITCADRADASLGSAHRGCFNNIAG